MVVVAIEPNLQRLPLPAGCPARAFGDIEFNIIEDRTLGTGDNIWFGLEDTCFNDAPQLLQRFAGTDGSLETLRHRTLPLFEAPAPREWSGVPLGRLSPVTTVFDRRGRHVDPCLFTSSVIGVTCESPSSGVQLFPPATFKLGHKTRILVSSFFAQGHLADQDMRAWPFGNDLIFQFENRR